MRCVIKGLYCTGHFLLTSFCTNRAIIHCYFSDLQKGYKVAIYMPMIVEIVVAMLACARIGVIHSIVVRSSFFSRCNLGS